MIDEDEFAEWAIVHGECKDIKSLFKRKFKKVTI